MGDIIEFKQFVVPMLMFIIPLVDTITVTIRRLMRKQSPFVGGKDHITHMLFYFGFKERMVAFILTSISLISIPLCVLLLDNIVAWTWVATLAAFVYFAFVFVAFQVIYNIGAKRKAELDAQKAKQA